MPNRSLIAIETHPPIGKIGEADYFRMYAASLADPDRFWGEHGKRVDWIKPYAKVCNASFADEVSIRWYEDGTLNASYNCIDRHLAKRAEQTAILWEGDDPAEDRRVTYRELHDSVSRLANALKARGVRKGDRVTIYMPMIPEAAMAMLACARIGAIHSVVFGGFSPDSLAGRIEDCRSTVLITADEGLRGGRKVPLKRNADTALRQCPDVKTVIVVKRTGGDVRLGRRPRPVVPRGLRRRLARLPAHGDVGRRPALHPLHLGFDRQTERRLAHDRRLSRLCLDDARIRLRLPRAGGLLVHRRCRLGHRAQLYCVRAAGQRRDDADVRGSAEPSRPVAFLAGRRQAQGVDILYRPDGDPRLDARGRGLRPQDQPQVAAPARHGRRADQPRSLDVVLRAGRRGALPDRRYLVADRDRRHIDHPAPRRDAVEARLGDAAVFRRRAGHRRWRGQPARRRRRRQSVPGAVLARHDAHRVRRPWALYRNLFLGLPRPLFHRRRCAARRGRLLLDHRPGRRRDQCRRAPPRHRRDRKRPRRPPQGRRGGGRRLPARHQGPGHLCLRHAPGG